MQAAQMAVTQAKIDFSRAKRESAMQAQEDAKVAAEEARVAAIEYKNWTDAVSAARAAAATEVLQASFRARLMRAAGADVSVGAAVRDAAARAAARHPGLPFKNNQERFGLWARKRQWAARVLQIYVKAHMLAPREIKFADWRDDDDEDGDRRLRITNEACFRCGQLGHYAKRCPNWWRGDPTIECEAKLRVRTRRRQYIDDDGVLRNEVHVSTRVFIGPAARVRLVKLYLRVAEDGSVAADVQPRLSREAIVALTGKTQLCRAFERDGRCWRGAACTFAHGWNELSDAVKEEEANTWIARQMSMAMTQQGPTDITWQGQGQMTMARRPEATRVDDLYGQYKTTLCEAWATSGRCPDGENCRFAHGEIELKRKQRGLSERELFEVEKQRRSRMCRKFEQFGKCANGVNCLFAHGTEALARRQQAAMLMGTTMVVRGSGGDGGEPMCLCLKPFSGCRVWPIASPTKSPTGEPVAITHMIRPGERSGLNDRDHTLLGNLTQFCSTFYHVNSWEAGIKLCLHWPTNAAGTEKKLKRELRYEEAERIRKCSKAQVVVIARLDRNGIGGSGGCNGMPVLPPTLEMMTAGGVSPPLSAAGLSPPMSDVASDMASVAPFGGGGSSGVVASVRFAPAGAARVALDLTIRPSDDPLVPVATTDADSMLECAPCDDDGGEDVATGRGGVQGFSASEDTSYLYVARYGNCYRGNTDVNRHAEEFMLEDEMLLQAADAAIAEGGSAGLRLVMYMTYQPCHHSGGMIRRTEFGTFSGAWAQQHPATCSERLRDFYLKELEPRGVQLLLVVADVYKATWDEELHPSEVEKGVYGTKSSNAREGMRMLMDIGVMMRSMEGPDWSFLIALCDGSVQEAYEKRGTEGSPFTKLHVGLRTAMDGYLGNYIDTSWRRQEVARVAHDID